VWLDWATFTSAACAAANPFTQNELQNLLVRAMETWNTESGSAVTLQFMGTSSTNGPVRVTAACIGNFAGRVVMANQNQYQCDTGGTMQFQLQLNQLQASGYDGNYSNTARNDAQAMITHELGHVLGLTHPHWCDFANGCCALSDRCEVAGNFFDSTMLSTLTQASTLALGEPNDRRHLWAWDVQALRHTDSTTWTGRFRPRAGAGCVPTPTIPPNPNCCNATDTLLTNSVAPFRPAGYGVSTSRSVELRNSPRVSSPRAWSSAVASIDTALAVPGATFGYADYSDTGDVTPSWCPSGSTFCPQHLVALASTSVGGSVLGSRVYTRVTDTNTWGGAGTGGPVSGTPTARTNHRPAVAYGFTGGQNVWLMVHVAADNTRRLYQQISDDGVHWSNPALLVDQNGVTVSSPSAPSAAFSASTGRFVLVWPDRVTNLLHSMTTTSPQTSNQWLNHATTATVRAQLGVEIACDSGSANCLLLFQDDVVSGTSSTWWYFRNGATITGGGALSPAGTNVALSSSVGTLGAAWGGSFVNGYVAAGLYSQLWSLDRATATSAGTNGALVHTGVEFGSDISFSWDDDEFVSFFLTP